MSDSIRNLELIETELSNLDFDIDLEDFQYNLDQGITDFEINNYRFIHQGSIDEIQCNELESDEYILGCFTDWFLADVLELDIDVVQAMQKAEAFEALGKMVLSMDKLETLQEQYVSADGYGNHFAIYDGNEHEVGEYLAFRVN